MVDAIDIASPVVAVGAAFILYVLIGRSNLLARADWREIVRRRDLPQLNRFARRNGLADITLECGQVVDATPWLDASSGAENGGPR